MSYEQCEQSKARNNKLMARVQILEDKRNQGSAAREIVVLGEELIGFEIPLRTVEDFKAFDQCLKEDAKKIEVVCIKNESCSIIIFFNLQIKIRGN